MKILESVKAVFKDGGKGKAPAKPAFPAGVPRIGSLEAEDAGVAKWAVPAKPGGGRAKSAVIDVTPEGEEEKAGGAWEDLINEILLAAAKAAGARARRRAEERVRCASGKAFSALERWLLGREGGVFKGFPWEQNA